MKSVEEEIREIVNKETRAWDTKDVKLLMTVFHPDMVWPWPPTSHHHNPVDWVFWAGRYNYERWSRNWQQLFDTHELAHNRREIRKIVVTAEEDGAFAVVDVDTLWRDENGHEQHWKGRACKVYSKVNGEWKMTMHTGLLDYGNVLAMEPRRITTYSIRRINRILWTLNLCQITHRYSRRSSMLSHLRNSKCVL